MHVRLELGDVADIERARGPGHELHHADRTDRAARVLVEARFLVAERRDHQRIEAVARRVPPKQHDRRLETLPVRLGAHVAQLLDVGRIVPEALRARSRILVDEFIDHGGEPRAAGTEGPADLLL